MNNKKIMSFLFDLIIYAIVLYLVIEVHNMKKSQSAIIYDIHFEVNGDTLFIKSNSIKHIRIGDGINTIGYGNMRYKF